MAQPPINYIAKCVLGLILLIPFAIYLGLCGLYHIGNKTCEVFNEGLESGQNY